MPQFRIPGPLRRLSNGELTVAVEAGDLRSAVEELERKHPGFKERLLDDQGEVRQFVNIFLNDEDVRLGEGLDARLKPSDEISIVPAVAGGCHPEVAEGGEAPPVARREVRAGDVPALYCTPQVDSGAAVLIAHDIYGRSPFYENLAARLATAGFRALLPDLFHREGPLVERTREAAMERMGRSDRSRWLPDLQAALRWLRSEGSGGRVGTVGFCMGGTLVLRLAAADDDLATVCYYGFPAQLAADEADRIAGPLLGFWGDQDEGVGMENVGRLDAALTRRGIEHEFEIYPGLGHGFLSRSELDPGNPMYQPACDSWTRAIQFYRENLREPAAVR